MLTSRLLKGTLLLVVLGLVLVGVPIGMPMATCPQCVVPAAALCLLVALLATAAVVVAPDGPGRRADGLPLRLHAGQWARPLERPPQPLLPV